MTTPCCCTGTKPVCDICVEGSNVLINDYPGFVFDGETQFADVTTTEELFVIPNGCVTDGHSTSCFDVLSIGWTLGRISVSRVGDVCYDYFGDVIDCATVACWWSSPVNYVICPNNCTIGPDSVCAGGPRGNDELQAQIVVDASTDPTYVLMIVQVTSDWNRFHCCIDGDPGTGAYPIYRMRVFYRVPKTSFTCLCALCFEKYDEQLILGAHVPCLTFPDHIKVYPLANGATEEQIANANAMCSDPDYNVDCAVVVGCGEAACSYTADSAKVWQNTSGICVNGCICPDNNALILAGYPRAGYVGQVLTVTIGCTPGERPCSELLGRCCSKDSDGENVCTDDISECDCNLLTGGCWNIGTGIDCTTPNVGSCQECAPIVGICCWDGNCLDNVTQTACSDASGGTGCWVAQNEAGDFTCATDHGGCSGCSPDCDCGTNRCHFASDHGSTPTGWAWYATTEECGAIGCVCDTPDAAFYAAHGYPSGAAQFLNVPCSGC